MMFVEALKFMVSRTQNLMKSIGSSKYEHKRISQFCALNLIVIELY